MFLLYNLMFEICVQGVSYNIILLGIFFQIIKI